MKYTIKLLNTIKTKCIFIENNTLWNVSYWPTVAFLRNIATRDNWHAKGLLLCIAKVIE